MDDTPAEQGLEADDTLPAAEATAAPKVEPGETPETPEESGAKPAEKPEGVQKRIDELTRRRYEAERKAAYWEGKATAGQPVSIPETDPVEARPKQKDFDSYESFIEAVTDWKLNERLTAERTRIQEETQKQTVVQDFESQMKSAREKHADFDQVVYNPDLRISETMRDAILHSEDGATLAYHLGHNPEEAARIASLPERAQIIEIGALIGMRRLQAKLDAAKVPAPSNAPAPISPVRASAPSHTGLREDLPIGDWMRRRNADLHKR